MPPPLAHLYRWEGADFGQNIYAIKVRCYWEHLWGTYWEPIGNLKGTYCEQRKMKKNPPLPTQNLKEKNQGTLSACWAFPLTAWNFYFQNYSSPFLAWANTSIINWGYLFHASINWWGVCPKYIFFLFFRRSHAIGPSPLFLEHGALPNI